MITDKDLKKILDTLLRFIATKEDLRMQTEEIEDKLIAFRSDILSHVDANYKEILAVREEQTMHAHTHMRQDEKHEDHEKRIRKLETVSAAP